MIELGEELLHPLHRHFINITYRDHQPDAVQRVKPTGNVIAFCDAQPFIKTLKKTWLNRQT